MFLRLLDDSFVNGLTRILYLLVIDLWLKFFSQVYLSGFRGFRQIESFGAFIFFSQGVSAKAKEAATKRLNYFVTASI